MFKFQKKAILPPTNCWSSLAVFRNQIIESAYIHIAVITPTAIVIISTLMLMVLKRIRLWISAINFTLWSDMRIRQIKVYDEFLLFLRERVNSIDPIRTKSQWGQRVSWIEHQAVADKKSNPGLDPWSNELKNKRLRQDGEHQWMKINTNLDSEQMIQSLWIHASREALVRSTTGQTSSDK